MKSTMWRLLLTLLLAVTLPLQGYAAHALQLCGLGAADVPALQSAPQHGGAHAQTHAEHHVYGADAQAMSSHATASADFEHGGCEPGPAAHCHEQDAGTTGEHGACSACAACCHAVALITELPQLHMPTQHPPGVATVPSGHEGTHRGGLERPPRSLQH
ncbi:MAG: hypothetical protein ACOVLH_15995 [Roseateles sp.]